MVVAVEYIVMVPMKTKDGTAGSTGVLGVQGGGGGGCR